MGKHVFLSYSHEDADVARALIGDLAKMNIEVWVDKNNLQVGTPNWRLAIEQAIRSSQAVIFIASPSSKASDVVSDELGRAKDASIPIMPFWVDGSSWFDTAPLGLGGIQYVDARGTNYRIALAELVSLIRLSETDPAQAQRSISQNTTNALLPEVKYSHLRVLSYTVIFGLIGLATGVFFRIYLISNVIPQIVKWSDVIAYVRSTFGNLLGSDTASIQNTVTLSSLAIIGLVVGLVIGAWVEGDRVATKKKELESQMSPKTKVPQTDLWTLFMEITAAANNNDRERLKVLISTAPDWIQLILRLQGYDPNML